VLRTGAAVHAMHAHGDVWQLLDADGRTLADSRTVVLANARDAARLLGRGDWPLRASRGQVTLLDGTGLPRPRVPLAGDGYAITLPDGRLLCGATRHADTDDASLRTADHAYNVERLRRLTGAAPSVDVATLAGRVGWRLAAPDRRPLVGAVPVAGAAAARMREMPRVDGLFLATAFGSRGITWAPLAGALVAAWAAGDPFPLEARGIDALDPARFTSGR
jgi:tRNA 5-methylaminomethyl-2-thiouridine biosynthesis bifunctional protein